MLTVMQIELIRRKLLIDGLSQREVARKLGHSRKTVKKALEHPVPPGYRQSATRSQPARKGVRDIVHEWLQRDLDQPRKQRHSAQRIFERLCDEHGYTGSYSSIQRTVREWKQNYSRLAADVTVPMVYSPGEEAQVDWGEATVRIGGVDRVVNLFCIRMNYSHTAFVRAYTRQDQVSFLDGHVRAFEAFGGIPRRLAYDNLKTAVIRVGRGRERDLNPRFVELRSWYLFDTRFCNVASGHEKGHVENLVKRAQRQMLTPVPEVASLDELNVQLANACRRELQRAAPRGVCSDTPGNTPGDRSKSLTMGDLYQTERAQLLPLPPSPFAACEQVQTRSDQHSTVRFDNCAWSVPVRHANCDCMVRGYLDRIEIFCNHTLVATHQRPANPEAYVLDPLHYLPILERKPGVIFNGRPFQGDGLGSNLSLLRRELEYRYGGEGTLQFLRVLLLAQDHPLPDVLAAVSACVNARAFTADAIEHALRNAPLDSPRVRLALADRPDLQQATAEIRPASDYDRLIALQREGSSTVSDTQPATANKRAALSEDAA